MEVLHAFYHIYTQTLLGSHRPDHSSSGMGMALEHRHDPQHRKRTQVAPCPASCVSHLLTQRDERGEGHPPSSPESHEAYTLQEAPSLVLQPLMGAQEVAPSEVQGDLGNGEFS